MDIDIFTYKNWLIHLFDIGKVYNFKGFPHPPTTAENFDEHWGGVKVTTNGMTTSVIFVKRNQAETEMIHVDDDDDTKMMDKKENDEESKSSLMKKNLAGDKEKLSLPLPEQN